jgi:5'-deoxynucleotidase
MAELTLEERLRTGHVHRWQIVNVHRQQTLAEHLYLVRVITLEIAKVALFADVDILLAEQWALEHDVPEVVTGDLATPVKAAMREAIPHDDPVRRIELSISQRYCDLYSVVKEKDHVRTLVKMADLIEAVNFLTEEAKGVHGNTVRKRLWDTLYRLVIDSNKKHPDYDWNAVYAVARKLTGA